MRAAYEWLYGTWLVQSGREAADAPVFEEYLNSPKETAPSESADRDLFAVGLMAFRGRVVRLCMFTQRALWMPLWFL